MILSSPCWAQTAHHLFSSCSQSNLQSFSGSTCVQDFLLGFWKFPPIFQSSFRYFFSLGFLWKFLSEKFHQQDLWCVASPISEGITPFLGKKSYFLFWFIFNCLAPAESFSFAFAHMDQLHKLNIWKIKHMIHIAIKTFKFSLNESRTGFSGTGWIYQITVYQNTILRAHIWLILRSPQGMISQLRSAIDCCHISPKTKFQPGQALLSTAAL